MPKKSSITKSGSIVYIQNDTPKPDAPPINSEASTSSPVSEPSLLPAPESATPAPAPAPAPTESIAPTTLQKQKQKRTMTEAKKAHLARLAELNRQRREEKKRQASEAKEVIPPDAVPVVVRPKRGYKKQDREFWEAVTTAPQKMAEIETLPKNEVVYPPVVQLKRRPTPPPPAPRSAPPMDYPVPKSRGVVKALKASPKVVKSRASRRPRPIYESDSESEPEPESEESSDEEVERYVKKTHKRISTLEKIDQRLQALRNPYQAYGLSAF